MTNWGGLLVAVDPLYWGGLGLHFGIPRVASPLPLVTSPLPLETLSEATIISLVSSLACFFPFFVVMILFTVDFYRCFTIFDPGEPPLTVAPLYWGGMGLEFGLPRLHAPPLPHPAHLKTNVTTTTFSLVSSIASL